MPAAVKASQMQNTSPDFREWRSGLCYLISTRSTNGVLVSYLGKFGIQNTTVDPMIEFAGSIDTKQTGGLSHPKWKIGSGLDYLQDGFKFGIRWRYIGEMVNSPIITKTTDKPVPAFSHFDLHSSDAVNEVLSVRAGLNN